MIQQALDILKQKRDQILQGAGQFGQSVMAGYDPKPEDMQDPLAPHALGQVVSNSPGVGIGDDIARVVSPLLGMTAGASLIGMGSKLMKKKSPIKVHPEDAEKMIEFIDSVRLNKKNDYLTKEATRLAGHYGLKIPKKSGDLTRSFQDILQKIDYGK